ncbi:hypothetical protein F5Y18DRAFT_380000 [Xylariaceae sp. FL1019]|nr:hypothetical protein F5Y18DRAFT_380000 [Xylariaceae sp. FL1019]
MAEASETTGLVLALQSALKTWRQTPERHDLISLLKDRLEGITNIVCLNLGNFRHDPDPDQTPLDPDHEMYDAARYRHAFVLDIARLVEGTPDEPTDEVDGNIRRTVYSCDTSYGDAQLQALKRLGIDGTASGGAEEEEVSARIDGNTLLFMHRVTEESGTMKEFEENVSKILELPSVIIYTTKNGTGLDDIEGWASEIFLALEYKCMKENSVGNWFKPLDPCKDHDGWSYERTVRFLGEGETESESGSQSPMEIDQLVKERDDKRMK